MYTMDEFIAHHGILGQRWGIRRYQNKDGSLTAAGRKHWDQLDRKTKAKIKDNMIRSGNAKVIQANQRYLTPNEIRKATERLAANRKVSDFNEAQINRGIEMIADFSAKASVVANSVSNLAGSYNKLAKVINGVSGKDLPIIGESKKPREFSYEDLKKVDVSKLKGQELKNAQFTVANYDSIRRMARQQRLDNETDKEIAKQKIIDYERKKQASLQSEIARNNEKLKAFNEKRQQEANKANAQKQVNDYLKRKEERDAEYAKMNNQYKQAAGRKDDINVPKKETAKMLPAVIKTETSKPISSFKEHYTSDDISSARNYVLSNFGNVSYNSIGNYKYSNPMFSAQYNKMTERNNNRNPYYVSHADMSYDALIASFAN